MASTGHSPGMMRPTSNIPRALVSLLAFTGLAVVTASCTSSVGVGCGDGPSCPDDSGVAAGKMVQDLTPEDRDAWCSWFVAYSAEWAHLGEVTPSSSRVNADGTLNTTWAACSTADTEPMPLPAESYICVPAITVEECKQSLALQPCTATIQALDDCARMAIEFLSDNDPSKSCTKQKSRCDAFLAAESCDGTVLGRGHPDPMGGWEPVCPFRVQ